MRLTNVYVAYENMHGARRFLFSLCGNVHMENVGSVQNLRVPATHAACPCHSSSSPVPQSVIASVCPVLCTLLSHGLLLFAVIVQVL